MRILIIDDDADLRNLLERYIKQQWPDSQVDQYDPLDHDMPAASFPLGSYDVMILDYMLGRGDGLQWLQELKRRADCPPVLFLTGAGNEIIAVRAMKAGADDYQRKQELTREKLITSIRDLTAHTSERTLSPELAARMEGHSLGARMQIPGIKVLHLIGEGGMSRVYLANQVQHLDAGNLHPCAQRVAFHARGELGRNRPFARMGSEVADGSDQLLSRQFLLALVVVRAGLHGAHRDDRVACSREKQDRRAVGAALEFLQPLQAVAAPQHVVEDHYVVVAERNRRWGNVMVERGVL